MKKKNKGIYSTVRSFETSDLKQKGEKETLQRKSAKERAEKANLGAWLHLGKASPLTIGKEIGR